MITPGSQRVNLFTEKSSEGAWSLPLGCHGYVPRTFGLQLPSMLQSPSQHSFIIDEFYAGSLLLACKILHKNVPQ